jgi:hypothetical protein
VYVAQHEKTPAVAGVPRGFRLVSVAVVMTGVLVLLGGLFDNCRLGR